MPKPPNGGDGISFFLVPNGSQAPDQAWGGCLALISNCSDFNTTGKAIVAVEFDTYQNHWDPSDNHVGINVNSIMSVASIQWNRSIKDGSKANAWVTYNSRKKNLSLFLTYDDNHFSDGESSLSYKIDLSKGLPEFVTIGFSSSTGIFSETHDILSWEFHAEFSGSSKKNICLIVGCVIGGVFLLVGGLISLLALHIRRNKTKKLDGNANSDDFMDHKFEQETGPKRFSDHDMHVTTAI